MKLFAFAREAVLIFTVSGAQGHKTVRSFEIGTSWVTQNLARLRRSRAAI